MTRFSFPKMALIAIAFSTMVSSVGFSVGIIEELRQQAVLAHALLS